MNTDLEIIFIAISAIAAVIALLLSLITFYKTTPPLTVTINNQGIYEKGIIGYFDTTQTFIPIFADETGNDLDLLHITIRIINPRAYPISLFNIYVSDENKKYISYIKQIEAASITSDMKLFAKVNGGSLGVTLPYSHYTTIPSGSFSHVDIFLETKDLCNCKKIHLTFRDSSKTFFAYKNRKIIGGIKLKHPLHRRTLNLGKDTVNMSFDDLL